MAPQRVNFGGPPGSDYPGKPSPEVGQDLSDIMSAGAEDGEKGVADGAPLRAA